MSISSIDVFNSVDSYKIDEHQVDELQIFLENGVEKIRYLGSTAELLGHGIVHMGSVHPEVNDYQFSTQLNNGIQVCWKWYERQGKGSSNYQREDLDAVYDWGSTSKLALLEDQLGHFYLINPSSGQKVMRVYKYSNQFYSYVDPEFIKEQALRNEGKMEYHGLIGTYGTIVSYSRYESDRCISLSNGQKFTYGYGFPIKSLVRDPTWDQKFPHEGIKVAIIKPPFNFENCSFFARHDSYLVLIEINGEWLPFKSLKRGGCYDYYPESLINMK